MGLSKTFAVLTVTVVLMLCLNADAAKQPKARTELDIKTPLSKILASLENLIANFKLPELINAILAIIPCLPASTPEGDLFKLGRVIDISALPLTPEMREMKLTSIKPLLSEDITEYCNSKPFAEIHNATWVTDDEAEDLLKFFFRFGYPGAYKTIQFIYEYYECDPELIKTLPKEPTDSKTRAKRSISTVNRNSSLIRQQMAQSFRKNEMQVQAGCDIVDIITKLVQSGVLNIIGLLRSIITEFSTNPSLHFLVGKVQEPTKGYSFRNFRTIEPVRNLLYKAHQALLTDETLHAILTVVKETLGVDLIESNFLETIVNVIEMILWENPNPLPPYYPPPPTPEPTTTEEPTTVVDSALG